MHSDDEAIAQSWAICRCRFQGPFIILDYRDSSRSTFHLAFPYWQISPIVLPPLTDALQALVGPPRIRQGAHGGSPIPVPIYFSLPRGLQLGELQIPFFGWLDVAPWRDRYQIVELSRARRIRRDLFAVPMRILAEPGVFPLLNQFGQSWWAQQQDVLSHGLQIEALEGDLELTLRTEACSILVVESGRRVAPVLRRLPVVSRPRLLIVHDASHPSIAATATLSLYGPTPPPFLMEFLLNIIHDVPLHEAFKRAVYASGASMLPPTLIADPLTNQSLRLREALIALKRHSDRLHLSSGAGLLEPRAVEPAAALVQSIQSQVQEVRGLDPAVFERETTGLAPLATHSRMLSDLGQSLREVLRRQRAPVTDVEPARRRLVPRPGPRTVDVALLRIDTVPLYRPVERIGSLAAGAAYDLRVHIGMRLPESLVSGRVTPTESLLGPQDTPEGHRLAVSVQGKDFRVIGPSLHPLLLPREGPSDPVYFRIRAPTKGTTAELRIYLHYRNHLVQTLLLRASITEAEGSDGSVRVTEEFSRSDLSGDFEALGPRAMSMGLNQGAQGTHQINLLSGNVRDEVALSALAFDQAVSELRQELRDRILVNGLARVFDPVAPGQAPSAAAAQAIRGLARKGRAVYEALFGSVKPDLRAALVRLQGEAGKKIQIVRFDPRSAFPWPLLYDWILPRDITGVPEPPICLGTMRGPTGQSQPCDHHRDSRTICTRGFWGIRHIVEELLPQMGNAQSVILRPVTDPVWIISSTAMPQARDLAATLRKELPAGIREGPWTEDQVLDLLWKTPAERPAVLILLGHLSAMAVANEPNAPRVELAPQREWFTLTELSNKVSTAPTQWGDPRTVLILAACDSAATSAETLNDFVTAFNTAGAGAIVGTQLEVGQSLAVRFAEAFTKQLWTQPLGEAMQAVRTRIVESGDPGGFLFQSFGDIDLRLQ